MKIFITGATGFIGSRVVNILQCQGHELVCLVRKLNDKSKMLEDLGARLVLGDVGKKDALLEGMRGCHAVIHIAAIYAFWIRDNSQYRKVNIDGTRNVMEAALESKISKIIHVSTALIWGLPVDRPFTETSQPGSRNFSSYSRSKYEADQIVWELYSKKNLPVVVIYPGGVLGAGDAKPSGSYIFNFIKRRLPAQVLSDSFLTWVHVDDVADGIVKALIKTDNIGEKYLLAAHPISMAEYNKLISKVSGVPVPKFSMPDFMTLGGAWMLAPFARIIGKEPMLGMSIDQIRVMKSGFVADGSKAERELGIRYTPLRKCIEDELSTFKQDTIGSTVIQNSSKVVQNS